MSWSPPRTMVVIARAAYDTGVSLWPKALIELRGSQRGRLTLVFEVVACSLLAVKAKPSDG
jgi:hypothetical protein